MYGCLSCLLTTEEGLDEKHDELGQVEDRLGQEQDRLSQEHHKLYQEGNRKDPKHYILIKSRKD
jgi:hypothetical protein